MPEPIQSFFLISRYLEIKCCQIKDCNEPHSTERHYCWTCNSVGVTHISEKCPYRCCFTKYRSCKGYHMGKDHDALIESGYI